MDLATLIWNWAKKMWNFIKKIVVKVINFFKNLVEWFKDPSRLEQIRKNKDIVAASVKHKLENGDYAVVNVLFDKSKDEIVDAQIVEGKNLDSKTKEAFGNKDMIILT